MNNPYYTIFTPVFDDGADGPAAPPAAAPAAPPAGTEGTAAPAAAPAAERSTFTQDDVNRMLAEDKRKHQEANRKTMDEVDALKTKVSMSTKERQDLNARLEEQKRAFLTKEELATREAERQKSEAENALKTLTDDRDQWKNRYEEETIVRSITDEAVRNDAFVPEQLVAILQPRTQLAEVLNDDGHPSGMLEPKVKFADTDSEGNPVELVLPVGKAVTRMKELEKFQNLFRGQGTGGLGSSNNSAVGAGEIDVVRLAKENPALYRKYRAEGKIIH